MLIEMRKDIKKMYFFYAYCLGIAQEKKSKAERRNSSNFDEYLCILHHFYAIS